MDHQAPPAASHRLQHRHIPIAPLTPSIPKPYPASSVNGSQFPGRNPADGKTSMGITKLYNQYFHEPTSQLFKLHAKLDALVLQAYGFYPGDDLLEKLLALNLELAEKAKRGEAIVDPWAPNDSHQ